MKLYWIKAQAPRRALALAKYLSVKVEFIEMNLMAGEMKSSAYAKLNPNMKAPTLVDGENVIWESAAIMAYLCMKMNSDMWPADQPLELIEIQKWISWNQSHWDEAVSPYYFEHIVKPTYAIGPVDPSCYASAGDNFRRFAKVLDDHLAHSNYVACKRLTIADFQLASMARYWRESEMPMAEFKNIVRWLDALDKIPEWKNPWPPSKYALR